MRNSLNGFWLKVRGFKSISLLSILGLVVILFSLFLTTYLVQRETKVTTIASEGDCPKIPRNQLGEKPDIAKGRVAASLLDIINKELLRTIDSLQRSNPSEKVDLTKKLRDTVSVRKKLLIDAMRVGPDTSLNNLLSDQGFSLLSGLSQNCLETPITLEGTLEVLHADFFSEGVSDTSYVLFTNDGRQIQLHPAGRHHAALESGTKVRVKGILLDEELLFDASISLSDPKAQELPGGIEVISQPGNPPVTGEQKTIIILANFQNTTQPTLTQAQVNDFLVGQLASYYSENSYTNINITGNVVGWYNLPINQTCDYISVRNSAVDAVDPVVFFPDYSRLIIIAPYGPSCVWAGVASLGKTIVPTDDGSVSMSWASILSTYGTNLLVVGHEMGHNFGNHHATLLDCGNVTIAASGCTVFEYGDPYDVMGNTRAFHYNIHHKEIVGWYNAANIQTVTANGSYTLEPLVSSSSALKALKIQRASNDYIFVEYRQPIGFDTIVSPTTDIYQGGLLHSLLSPGMTALLDPTPLDSTSTITLKVGSSFTDPATGTQITTSARTSNSLTLDVSLGKTDFTPPTVNITSPLNGSTVSGIVTVAGDVSDASGIQKVEFYLDGTAAVNLLNTDLDASYGFSWDTSQAANGTHVLYAKAYDRSGEPWNVPGNFAWHGIGVTVSNSITPTSPPPTPTPSPSPTPPPVASPTLTPSPTPALDTIPPSVSITSPLNGSIVSRNSTITIIASASDNVAVVKVEFLVNGGLKCTDTISPYACSWKVPGGKPGVKYILQAKAYDAAGNSSSHSISVTSK